MPRFPALARSSQSELSALGHFNAAADALECCGNSAKAALPEARELDEHPGEGMHPSEFTKIVLLTVAAAWLYAAVHNLLGAIFCPEYLTAGLPPVFGTTSSFGLSLGWALVGTWWLTLVLGLALAVLCRVGPEPYLSARQLLKPGAYAVATVAAVALVAGIIGALVGSGTGVPSEYFWQVSPDNAAGFWANRCAEWAAYAAGIAAMFLLYRWVWQRRNLQQHVVESLGQVRRG